MAVMLCILQVILVVIRLHLIMSGDVELNPGPLDGRWGIRVHTCILLGYLANLKYESVNHSSDTFFWGGKF